MPDNFFPRICVTFPLPPIHTIKIDVYGNEILWDFCYNIFSSHSITGSMVADSRLVNATTLELASAKHI